MKLYCQHVDTCLSDFWSGHHAAHVSIPVRNGMSFKEVREAIHSELNAGAIAGSDDRTRDDSGPVGDAWYKAAHAAVNRDVRPAKKGARNAFPDLEKVPEDFDGCEVYAYFVFVDA